MSLAKVTRLCRYPVKSMGGEVCAELGFAARGVVGDRCYALVDVSTGKIASAKNPRLWPSLLSFGARYLEAPGTNGHAARVEVTMPDGACRSSDDPVLEAELATLLGRAVRFAGAVPERPTLEEYWPDLDDLAHRDEVTDEAMPVGTFFDCAAVHLLTTNSLDALHARYTAGTFPPARFRPNVLLEAPDGGEFVEDAWIGTTVRIGADVVLKVTGGAPRCVMTTLGHGDVAPDLGILRAAAAHHNAQVGVYADVVRGGTVAVGDTLVLL